MVKKVVLLNSEINKVFKKKCWANLVEKKKSGPTLHYTLKLILVGLKF